MGLLCNNITFLLSLIRSAPTTELSSSELLKYYESYYKLYTYNKKQREDDRERESRYNVPAYKSKRYLVM